VALISALRITTISILQVDLSQAGNITRYKHSNQHHSLLADDRDERGYCLAPVEFVTSTLRRFCDIRLLRHTRVPMHGPLDCESPGQISRLHYSND
jgi:hypothetical protein